MTVPYNSIGQVRKFGFFRLLFRWRASIWKFLWVEVSCFLVLFWSISLVYRYMLDDKQQDKFEDVVRDLQQYNTDTAMVFVLGFYVTTMFNRWWETFQNIPWVDDTAWAINEAIPGDTEEDRTIRRSLVRYLNLSAVLVYQSVSQKIQAAYSGSSILSAMGIATDEELTLLRSTPFDTHPYWIPNTWFSNLVIRCRKEGRIASDITVNRLMNMFSTYRGKLGTLLGYKWISIPLMYTQVVTFTVYIHFILSAVSAQFLNPDKDFPGFRADWGFPIMDTAHLIIYLGWLKSAEMMRSPFGHDEDAFELEWIMKRNVDIGFEIVDHARTAQPKLMKDKFWGQRVPTRAMRHMDEASLTRKRRCSYSVDAELLDVDMTNSDYKQPKLHQGLVRDPMREAMVALRSDMIEE